MPPPRDSRVPLVVASAAPLPPPSHEVLPPRPQPTSHKTDIEQLLPISQAVKSLPRPPRLPQIEAPDASKPRRSPWASLSVFAVMLIASGGSLLRYSAQPHAEPTTPPPVELALTAVHPSATRLQPAHASGHEREVVERIASGLWTEPDRLREALLAEGEQALEARDERLAEALFGRAFELAAQDARAEFGLARVRLAQGDLEAAEGWLLAAIAKQPGDPAYRALHATVLERSGRRAEAELERAFARTLAR